VPPLQSLRCVHCTVGLSRCIDYVVKERFLSHVRMLKGGLVLDKRSFKTQYETLLEQADLGSNQESLELRNSEGCVRCHFSNQCEVCFACTYAERSKHCTHCNRIEDCLRCHRSSHLTNCTDCSDSQYLIDCVQCSECTYCLGCVGLSRKEFHILNRPYDRKTYFQILKSLGLRDK